MAPPSLKCMCFQVLQYVVCFQRYSSVSLACGYLSCCCLPASSKQPGQLLWPLTSTRRLCCAFTDVLLHTFSCNKWFSQLPLPSYQLEAVSSDLWHQQGLHIFSFLWCSVWISAGHPACVYMLVSAMWLADYTFALMTSWTSDGAVNAAESHFLETVVYCTCIGRRTYAQRCSTADRLSETATVALKALT